MIVKYFLVILCIFIVDVTAGTIDCKTIDNKKFKELFTFKYSGGSLGLKFDFDFIGNTNTFKVNECTFEILHLKIATYGSKTFKKPANKNKLNGLQACTKYKVILTIKNSATKKTFDYENFVSTKPDQNTKIDMSTVEIGEDFVDFSWSSDAANGSGCIEKMSAVLKNKDKEAVVEHSVALNGTRLFTIDTLLPLKSYIAQLIALDDKGNRILSNELKIKMKSSEINNEIDDIDVVLKLANVKTNDAHLVWDLSEDTDSKLNYLLEVLDASQKVIFSNTLTNNSVVIRNLKACSEYKANLSESGSSKSSELTFETKYAAPSHVKNINYHANHTHSIFSWNPPDLNTNCVSNYTIIYQNTKDKNSSTSLQWTVAKNETSKVINRLPYTKKIYIHVYANYDTSDNATKNSKIMEFENFNIDEFVVKTIREFRLSATEVQLQWSYDTSYTSSILDYFEVFVEEKSFKMIKPLINLNIEACRKNYTIIIRCASKGGNVGPNVTYHTNLNDKEVQLSAINTTDINVHQNTDSVIITWKPNMNEASCIAYYEIKFAEEVFKTNEPKMEINKFQSCMLYQMSIVPVSESGTNGEITNYEFVTNVLAPQIPTKPSLVHAGNRELTISSSISDNDKLCVEITSTIIEFTCNNITVEKKITRSESQYVENIPNLLPNTKYLCNARVKNSNGTSGHSETAELKTLQDSPQPPYEIRSSISDDSVIVKWKDNNSTGFADYYQVHVKFVKFLYSFGKNCDKNLKSISVIEAVDPFVNISNLLPFSQYALKIVASNTYGKSSFSEEIIINTPPSSPTEPRNVTIKFQYNNDSKLSAKLSWKGPCMMNGKFSLYTITVNGQRKGVKSDKRTEASTIEEIELRDLSHGFKYDIEIQAVNQHHGSTKVFGKVVKFSFTAPSGIPEEEDLKDWTLLGTHPDKYRPNKIEIQLKRRMLISKVGDVTGIAFLIFLANCPNLPQPTFGYLSSNDDSLPPTQQNLNCSQLYQQTKVLSNPLIYDDEIESGHLDMYTTKFVIGDEDCTSIFKINQICNGPLKCDNCTFGIIARVFTRNGFRDTEPVFFETISNSEFIQLSPALLVFGSFLIILILSGVVCIFCCISIRRNRKIKKKKEAAETVENLLSFTSYCVIDKNPTPKHQFDHLL